MYICHSVSVTKTLRRAVKHAFDMIPWHASHGEGHIHLSGRLTDGSKGRQADTEKGTVNTPQQSQLAAGAFDSKPSRGHPGDRSHYVKCVSITHAAGQRGEGGGDGVRCRGGGYGKLCPDL